MKDLRFPIGHGHEQQLNWIQDGAPAKMNHGTVAGRCGVEIKERSRPRLRRYRRRRQESPQIVFARRGEADDRRARGQVVES